MASVLRGLMRPHPNRLKLELLTLALFCMCLSVWVAASTRAFTSDDVAQQNAVASLASHTHSAIELPQNTYVLKLPFYAALQLLPLSPSTRLRIEIIALNLASFALFYWAIRTFAQRYSLTMLSLASVLWLSSLGVGLGDVLANPNSRNLEIGLAFAGLAMLARWYNEESSPPVRRAITRGLLFAIALGLLFYNDPYFTYVLGTPVLLFFGGKWLLFGNDKRALWLTVTMIAAFVSAQVWYWLFWCLGIHAGRGTAVFATLPAIARNTQLFIQGSLDLFNANVFGQPVLNLHSFDLELNLLFLVATLLTPMALLSAKIRRDIWKVFLVIQPPLVAAIFIASGEVANAESERYLVMLPFYSALILAVVAPGVLARRSSQVLTAVLVLSATLSVAATINVYLGRSGNPNAENQLIAQIAKANHLAKGYASYWDAGINQYFADNTVLFIQAGCSRTSGVHPYRFLLNEQVLQRRATGSFYLFDPIATRCTESDLNRFFGQPQTTITLPGQKRLFLYGYDISKKLTGS